MKQRILFAALALLLLTACHKENPDPRMEITIEKLQGNGKLTLDGLTATWNDGDTIRLNGTPVVVERSGDHAYISNTASQSTNRAFFPTRLNPTTNEDAVTVTLPREYDYRSDGTRQQLTLPLAARATDDNPLHFMHLTGALCFMLTNSTSHPLTIDRITVSSNAYQLSGERNINLASIGSIGPNDGTGDDLTVAMTFTKQSLVIPASGNANVVLPIAPVDSNNRFTVTITCHYQGDRYVYTKTQGAGKNDRSLNRNEIGYAAMELAATSHVALFEGSGTDANPFLITSVTDFLLMAEAITNNWSCTSPSGYYKNYSYKITNNLDFTGLSVNPIRYFLNAQLDGDGHTLYNLTINSREDTCALFSKLTSATITNLTLSNLTLKHNGNSNNYLLFGGFCGSIISSTITNCNIDGLNLSITGNISAATTYIGGITARATKNNTLTNCTVNSSISFDQATSSLFFGNIISHCNEGVANYNNLPLTNCDATNTSLSIRTTNALYFGGIVGNIAKELLTLRGCDYTGNGTLTSSAGSVTAGGFVGRFVNGQTPGSLTITKCTASGTISVSGTSNNLGSYYGTSNNSNNIFIKTDSCNVDDFHLN